MEYALSLSRARAALQAHGLLLEAPGCPQELIFPAITYDSRNVTPGSLFVCKGLNFRPEYLQGALQQGAACYLAQQRYALSAPALLSAMPAGRFRCWRRNTTAAPPSSSPSSV